MKKLLFTITSVLLLSIVIPHTIFAEDSTTPTTSITPSITVSTTETEHEETSTIPSVTVSTSNKLLNEAQKHTQNQTDRLTKAKADADMWITERLSKIQNLLNKVNSGDLTANEKQSIVSSLNAETIGLTQLKAQIDTITDPSQLPTLLPLIKQIFTNFRVYEEEIPKEHAMLHIDNLSNLTTKFNTIEQNFLSDITFAASQNKNTTTLVTDNTKYTTDLAKFTTDLTAAQNTISAITPASVGTGSTSTVLQTAKNLVTQLHTDIQELHQDGNQFITDFKTLFSLK